MLLLWSFCMFYGWNQRNQGKENKHDTNRMAIYKFLEMVLLKLWHPNKHMWFWAMTNEHGKNNAMFQKLTCIFIIFLWRKLNSVFSRNIEKKKKKIMLSDTKMKLALLTILPLHALLLTLLRCPISYLPTPTFCLFLQLSGWNSAHHLYSDGQFS